MSGIFAFYFGDHSYLYSISFFFILSLSLLSPAPLSHTNSEPGPLPHSAALSSSLHFLIQAPTIPPFHPSLPSCFPSLLYYSTPRHQPALHLTISPPMPHHQITLWFPGFRFLKPTTFTPRRTPPATTIITPSSSTRPLILP